MSYQSEPTTEVADIINAVRLIRQEKKTGPIEVDERAGSIVLNQNLLDIPANQINDTILQVTIFDGTITCKDR
ncbi:MAG: hypothetical protein HOH37_05375 [Gammaproteobacteria bacterium]|nr:hypothetical protein [Gammaproteobacteria bacterium]